MDLKSLHKIFFIGIGGIGMSAIARYLHRLGKDVSGYDKTSTALTKKLESEGIDIHYEDDVSLAPRDAELIIYTPAVPADHKELTWYRDNGYPVIKRAKALGMISRDCKAIAVGGTHGKTTTCSLITQILTYSDVPFSAFLGGILLKEQSNYIHRGSEWVVLEADEYDRSFLHLEPQIAVLVSMDPDHLDVYGEHEAMKSGFWAFIKKVRRGGLVIYKSGLEADFPKNWQSELDAAGISFMSYGLKNADAVAQNTGVENGKFRFDYHGPEGIKGLLLAMPGRHNVENAVAAITCVLQTGIQAETIREALSAFRGIYRRYERIYDDGNSVYIDDYAHHPVELEAAIGATRELFPDKKITGIFQPHLYTRTRDFADGFAAALDKLDEVVLMDIYPAREMPIEGVSSKMIADRMKNPHVIMVENEDLMEYLSHQDIEVLLTLGAGDIDLFRDKIKNWLSNR